MKTVVPLVLFVAAISALVYAAVELYPRPVTVTVNKPVQETRTREYTVWVPYTSDGETKFRQETRSAPRYVTKFVPEEKTIEPTRVEQLQWFVLVIVAIFYGIYAMGVLLFWVRDKWSAVKSSEHSRDNENRLNAIVWLGAGLIAGLLGSALQATNETEVRLLRDEVEALQAAYNSQAYDFNSNYDSWYPPDSTPVPFPDDQSDWESTPTPAEPPETSRERSEPTPVSSGL